MVVISITIVDSAEQIVAGIPKTVSLSTNIPASIFYTLDGTTPTLLSTIYITPIFLAHDTLAVTLSIFASDGINTSPVIVETYITDMISNNARLPHSATDARSGDIIPDLYPFGTPPTQPQGIFLSPADAGITVDNSSQTQISSGFDGNGNPVGFTNAPYNLENYSVKYSTTDAEGQPGLGIGNLPATAKIKPEAARPEESQQFSALFDPRAFVIFQDFSKENPNDPHTVNRMFFSLEDPERIRDGNNYFNSGIDSQVVTGSFLRAHHNPTDNTITYYYLDTHTNRWIISKDQYRPTGTFDGNMANMPSQRANGGVGRVYEWMNFTRRVLF